MDLSSLANEKSFSGFGVFKDDSILEFLVLISFYSFDLIKSQKVSKFIKRLHDPQYADNSTNTTEEGDKKEEEIKKDKVKKEEDDEEEEEPKLPDTALLDVFAALNPLNEKQRLFPTLLLFLRKNYGQWLSGRVLLTPPLAASVLPMRSFYRYALFDEPRFDDEKGGQIVHGPKLVFPDIPAGFVFTMNNMPPSAWLTTAKTAVEDLDNIRFDLVDEADRTKTVHATYTIDSFIVTGGVMDIQERPSTGIPLTLVPAATSTTGITGQVSTTLAMQSNGYFQLNVDGIGFHLLSISSALKDRVGLVEIGIRARRGLTHLGSRITTASSLNRGIGAQYGAVVPIDNSLFKKVDDNKDKDKDNKSSSAQKVSKRKRSNPIPIADSQQNWNRQNVIVQVSSWDQTRISLRINAQFQRENLYQVAKLETDVNQAVAERDAIIAETYKHGIIGWIKRFFLRFKTIYKQLKIINSLTSPSHKGKEQVNIFTISSGHLYERLAKIMILSALNHTRAPVKFWFIGSVVSPIFRKQLPLMSQQLGFEYAFIDYAWPGWITEPTTKMRRVWATKILFLDVLFPLDVDRIIFVDADQISRTDMNQLIVMDLEGSPYGYTPMCNNRPEMEPFRFWERGYWKTHLQGKPYHISALYVVDLVRFRAIGAGDILRQSYENLAKDKNSLSNLDQDLPNYVQHTIPIHTLDQNWLWCGAWCSDETMLQARTIDLCNNPLTKEHKIEYAKRVIPEWRVYYARVLAMDKELNKQIEEEDIRNTNKTQEPQVPSTPETPSKTDKDPKSNIEL